MRIKSIVSLRGVVAALSVVMTCVSLRAATVPDFSQTTGTRIVMAEDLYPDLTSLTLSVWVKSSAPPVGGYSYGAIAGRGYLGVVTGFGLFMHNDGRVCFQTRNGGTSVQAAATFPYDGGWHHVAGVRDGNDTRIYIDGELLDTATGALATLFQSGRAFALGQRHGGGTGWGYPYNGLMAQVQLWDYARTAEQIQSDMFRRPVGDEPGLIGYWPLDEVSGVVGFEDLAADNDGVPNNIYKTSDIFFDYNLAAATNYLGYWRFEVADKTTGDTRLTTSNVVDIAALEVPDGYDSYQLSLNADPAHLDAEDWEPTASLPSEVALTATPGRAAVYAWFTNSNQSVTLRRSAAWISYLPLESALDISPRLPQRIEMTTNLYAAVKSLTLSAWIKTDVVPSNWGAIAGRGYLQAACSGFGLLLTSDGVAGFQVRNANTVVQANYTYPFDNRWHHIAGVRDDATNTTRLYLDGELVAEAIGALGLPYTADRCFAIGSVNVAAGWNYHFDGQIAEVRLWDYARSGEEINAERFECLSGTENGLLGYWPLTEGSGTTVYDRTELGVDGTCVNNPTWLDEGEGIAALLPAARRSGINSYLSFTLADPLIGNTFLTTTNECDLTDFPIPPGYDRCQIGVSPDAADIDAQGWQATNSPTELPSLTMPVNGGRVSYYAWFTNSAEEVALCRAGGSITYAPERPALDFTGGAGYVRMAQNLYQNVTNLTLSAWIKTDTLPSPYGAIVGRDFLAGGTGFGLFVRNDGSANFQTRNGNDYVVTASAAYPFDGRWHHIAGVREDNFTRLYIDGVLAAEEEGEVPTLFGTGRAFCLGARHFYGIDYYFNGSIAEVRLWDHARSGAKIAKERFYKLSGDEAGLIGYWPCDEGCDLRVRDATAGDRDGTFIGPTEWEYTIDYMRDRPPPGVLMMVR